MGRSKWAVFITVMLFAVSGVGTYQAIQILKAGAESYLFGYSLVLMDATRQSMIDSGQGNTPINHFAHVQYFPDHEFRQVVRPNNDTLYSTAWIDLTNEPLILSVPAVEDRYYVMPLMDAWTNVFASVGTRTTGKEAGDYIIAGPDWQEQIPPNLKLIRSPTNMVWMIGRIQTNTESDFANVAKLQQRFTLTPLSDWAENKPNPASIVTEPDPQVAVNNPSARVAAMTADEFFSVLSRLMGEQPPAKVDEIALNKLAGFGVEPGKPFEIENLGFFRRTLLEKSVELARTGLVSATEEDRTAENGWAVVREGIGVYGDQYQVRAFVSMIGLGALTPAEAAYPNAKQDGEGRPLTGVHRYRIRFEAGQSPPVDAFWSLTVYDEDGFLIDNPISRYALGDRDALTTNRDGSIDIAIQHQPPGGEISNWLPCPTGPFAVTMRLYLPQQEFLDGRWKLPPIERID